MLILEGTLVLAAPMILAAMGGWASERGGVINIALEGKMLIAAMATVVGSQISQNPIAGLLIGITAAILLSLAHHWLTQCEHLDPIVSGMALNAIAFGAADTASKRFLDLSAPSFPKLPLAGFWIFAAVLPFGLWWVSRQTRAGLRLTAVGDDPEKSRQVGLNPVRIRLGALVMTGVFCGVAGALLATNAGSYENNLTAGKGFIALAALILGGWRPVPSLAACLMVGLLLQLRISFQGVPIGGLDLPGWLWISLPYVVTIIALAGFLGQRRTPAGLGKL